MSPGRLPGTTSPASKDIADILESIDKRLSSFDARLSLVEILHREFKSLKESLEFSQQQVETLAAENATLRESVKSLTDNSVIDLQARSMRDNLVFSGIPESAGEDAEATVKSFIKTHLKLPEDTVKNIAFERTTSNCGQIRPIKTEGTGEESRQGAERNGLQRERPVPQRDPGMRQSPVPSST
ncbi:aryl hydrocarbon receptor nuclear translocator [Sarotherodon galilaeus]